MVSFDVSAIVAKVLKMLVFPSFGGFCGVGYSCLSGIGRFRCFGVLVFIVFFFCLGFVSVFVFCFVFVLLLDCFWCWFLFCFCFAFVSFFFVCFLFVFVLFWRV